MRGIGSKHEGSTRHAYTFSVVKPEMKRSMTDLCIEGKTSSKCKKY